MWLRLAGKARLANANRRFILRESEVHLAAFLVGSNTAPIGDLGALASRQRAANRLHPNLAINNVYST